MKYTVQVDGHTYVVEIKDLREYPVSTIVDGVEIKVYPFEISDQQQIAGDKSSKPVGVFLPPGVEPPEASNMSSRTVRAPIPGVIINVPVKPGDEIAFGEEICSLEAMKMRNIVRSSRSGKIAFVHVSVGQTVNHHDPLVDFEE